MEGETVPFILAESCSHGSCLLVLIMQRRNWDLFGYVGVQTKEHSRDKRGADTYLIPYVLLHRLACVRCVLELIDAAHGRISVGLFSARSDKPLDARTER